MQSKWLKKKKQTSMKSFLSVSKKTMWSKHILPAIRKRKLQSIIFLKLVRMDCCFVNRILCLFRFVRILILWKIINSWAHWKRRSRRIRQSWWTWFRGRGRWWWRWRWRRFHVLVNEFTSLDCIISFFNNVIGWIIYSYVHLSLFSSFSTPQKQITLFR